MLLKNKQIAFVLGNYWGQSMGGAELQAYFLEQAVLRANYKLHYCFLSNGDPINNKLQTILHPISQKKHWSKLGNIKYPYARLLLQRLSAIQPKIIYQRTGFSFTGVAAYYAKKHDCKLFFHIAADRDVERHTTPYKSPWLIPEYKLKQYGIKNADTIIAQTQFQALQLQTNYGRKAVVIPNGHPVPNDCRKIASPISVLWIANWKPVKQPEFFVRLSRKLSKLKNVRFIMLGRTGRYEQLMKKAIQIGVDVRGEVNNDEVNKLLKKSHLLVNTSKHEGFSNTFIQAWMHRVPVVSLHVDPDNILQKKRIGCCSKNFINLVQDTQRLIENDIQRVNMGSRAREYAKANYSLTNMDKIVELMLS